MSQFIYPDFPLAWPNIWHIERGGGIFKSEPEEPDAASAGETTWVEHIKSVYTSSQLSGNVFEKILHKDGETYLISNADELALLAYFSDSVHNNNDNTIDGVFAEYFRQIADIDLGGYIWTGIDATDTLWLSSYNGNGYNIYNLKSYSGGLFGDFTATDEDLSFDDIHIVGAVIITNTPQLAVGGLLDMAFGSYFECADCSVDAYIKCAAKTTAVGGVLGFLGAYDDHYDSWLWDVSFTGAIVVEQEADAAYIGGIVGASGDNNRYYARGSNFERCNFNGSIFAHGRPQQYNQYVGGIVGSVTEVDDYFSSSLHLLTCKVEGILHGPIVGGIIGENGYYGLDTNSSKQDLSIEDCAVYATIENEKESSNVFCGSSSNGFYPPIIVCQNNFFMGAFLGPLQTTFSFYNGEDGNANSKYIVVSNYGNYACINGEKRYHYPRYVQVDASEVWSSFRIVPGVNRGMPVPVGLFSVAQAAPEQDILQWFQSHFFSGTL